MSQRISITALVLALALPASVAAKPFSEMFPGASTGDEAADAFLASLDYKQGEIRLEDAGATLKVGPEFYYLDVIDTRKVLEDAWGNPPGAETLGMIFPADSTPLHDSWGATLRFDEIGYVSDSDAMDYDYDALLKSIQEDTSAANPQRIAAGYPAIEVVGWAAPPRYDGQTRKLHWAQELSFEGEETNTANYNIRALGRRGVLVTNFIATMDQIPNITAQAPAVMAMMDFEQGSRYADFDPSLDSVAAVGIGGLIAGKVAAKAGLFAVALVFLKKFWFILFLPLVWVYRKFRGS